jgi:hypothetical protein
MQPLDSLGFLPRQIMTNTQSAVGLSFGGGTGAACISEVMYREDRFRKGARHPGRLNPGTRGWASKPDYPQCHSPASQRIPAHPSASQSGRVTERSWLWPCNHRDFYPRRPSRHGRHLHVQRRRARANHTPPFVVPCQRGPGLLSKERNVAFSAHGICIFPGSWIVSPRRHSRFRTASGTTTPVPGAVGTNSVSLLVRVAPLGLTQGRRPLPVLRMDC